MHLFKENVDISNIFIEMAERYGNLFIFVSLFLSELGIPIPSETLMSFLGFVNSKSANIYRLYYSIISTIIGSLLGSNIAWYIGYKYGEEVLLKYGRVINLTKDKLTASANLLVKYRLLILLFGRFIPGIRHLVSYLCGISISFRQYLVYNFFGVCLFCISFNVLGYMFGVKWMELEGIVRKYAIISVIILIIAFIGFKLFNNKKLFSK
ncbi:MAG: DedA family protein [Bacillota bacterium]|nr:DedA family protein [Bacillota bacterium]